MNGAPLLAILLTLDLGSRMGLSGILKALGCPGSCTLDGGGNELAPGPGVHTYPGNSDLQLFARDSFSSPELPVAPTWDPE